MIIVKFTKITCKLGGPDAPVGIPQHIRFYNKGAGVK